MDRVGSFCYFMIRYRKREKFIMLYKGGAMGSLRVLQKEERENVREYAHRVLYENIINFQLIPVTAISEQEISSLLSVSRTPVREAFIRLQQKGLLEVLPQRGTFVSKIDTEFLSEFGFLRVTVENAMMKLACQKFPSNYLIKLKHCLLEQKYLVETNDADGFFRNDNIMHSLIYEGCAKSHIWNIIEDSNLDYLRVRVLNTRTYYELETLLQQHHLIVNAIEKGDVEIGVKTMTEHIDKVNGDVERLKVSYPDYFK